MPHNSNLKRKARKISESEEGEIEDITPKNEQNYNQDVSSGDYSEEENGGLDIKPPTTTKLKSEVSRKDTKEKHKRHSSHRKEHHDDREKRTKRRREEEERRCDYRDDPTQSRERERHRESKNIRSRGERSVEARFKDHIESFDDKKKEWREKRLHFLEKKREEFRTTSDHSKHAKESISNGKDLRDKLRDKERLQKERRLERFRNSPKSSRNVPSSIVMKKRDKTPEPIVNKEPMERDTQEEKENSSSSKSTDSDASTSSNTSSGSKIEVSSNSSDEENDESEDDDTSTEDSTDSSVDAEKKKVKDENKKQMKAVSKIKNIFSPYLPAIQGCRSVDEFKSLTRIEEGTFGVVYKATEKATGEIVALKRLKMEKEKEGFPITSLREINTLLKAQHQNIVCVREIVVGSNIDRIYIVMDYVEHDLRSLMKTMTKPFTLPEVNKMMVQLLRAVAHLHDNWILHRDLKPSNLLLSREGMLKVGDFGLAREYGSPLKSYTPVVVTLWYRAPELLLGTKKYSTAIDMWSVGCIFGELLLMRPLFPGEGEMDQLKRVFKELGTPSEKIWPGFNELPLVKKLAFANYPYNRLKHTLSSTLPEESFDLINRLLTYDPEKRITAEKALEFFDKNLEEEEEGVENNSIAEAISSFNLLGDYSVKGGGFSLKF